MIAVGHAGYWIDGEVRVFSGAFDSLPEEGVLWISLKKAGLTHALVGADGYWADGNQYGMTFEDAQPVYGGLLHAAWYWPETGVAEALPPWSAAPPPLVRVLRGVALPDEVWTGVLQKYLPEISGAR